jgi:hypothetical protein
MHHRALHGWRVGEDGVHGVAQPRADVVEHEHVGGIADGNGECPLDLEQGQKIVFPRDRCRNDVERIVIGRVALKLDPRKAHLVHENSSELLDREKTARQKRAPCLHHRRRR